jgi:hypothetical protein
MTDRVRAVGHQFTGANKTLEVQVVSGETPLTDDADKRFAQVFGSWCLVAPPPVPTTGPDGKIASACELFVHDMGDETVAYASRDARFSKYSQDVKAGEYAVFNAFGDRIFSGEKLLSIAVGGGFLQFDKTNKVVSLVGIPTSPGGSAGYLTVDSGVGIVSASGAASMLVKDSNAKIVAGDIALDGGSVSLGKGAASGVIRLEDMAVFLATLQTWASAVGTAAGVPAPPFTINASARVKAA